MFIYFFDDGTYSMEYDKSHMDHFEFGAVDISTTRKGPVLAFVDKPKFELTHQVELELLMQYGEPDIPFDPETTFHLPFDLSQEGKAYGIYPLIKQMIACNNFVDGQSSFLDSHIYIDKIRIKSDIGNYIITENTPDDGITDLFRELGLATCMRDVIEPGYVIMMNARGYWKRVKLIDGYDYASYMKEMKWDRVLVCFPEMETAYECRHYILNEMKKIDEFYVKIAYLPKTEINYTYDFESMCTPSCVNTYQANNVDDILKTCLFVPQILMIEQSLYNLDATVQITIIQDERRIRLELTNRETLIDVNTCIYNLLEDILNMTYAKRMAKEEYYYAHINRTDPRAQRQKPNRRNR